MGSFCAQHALDGIIVDVTTTITTATTNDTTSRSSFAEVDGSTQELDGVGGGGEPEPKRRGGQGRSCDGQGRRSGVCQKPAARKLPPRVSVDLELDAAGKEGIVHRVD